MLSENAKKFLKRKPTLIQTIQGYKFYECPVNGDDVPMRCITPEGKLKISDFMERLDHDDLSYQIEEWGK